jgi:hypothetical protein
MPRHQLEYVLPTFDPSSKAFLLMWEIRDLAQAADRRGREYITWQAMRMADELRVLAAESAQTTRPSRPPAPNDHTLSDAA